MIRYPDITVQVTGEDGNAYAIMGRVTRAMKKAGVPKAEIDKYIAEATSGDYNHLLVTTMNWVDTL